MAYVVNPLSPDGSSARAAPAASSRTMSPEIGDTDMLDPIVRAAAHPSRAILDAPARRYRLSETGNVKANGSFLSLCDTRDHCGLLTPIPFTYQLLNCL